MAGELGRVGRWLFLGVLFGLVSLPGVAGAATFTGQAVGSSNGALAAHQDVTGLSVTYDDSGEVTAVVKLRGAAPAGTTDLIGVMLGSAPSGAGCAEPTMLGLANFSGAAIWDMGDQSGNATASVNGGQVTIKLKDQRLAKQSFRCATAFAAVDPDPNASGDTQIVDLLDAAATLTLRQVKKPKLKLAVSGAKSVKPGKSARLTAKVTNIGRAKATAVKLQAKAGRGATVKPGKKSLGALGPGRSKVVKLKVKASSGARGRLTVDLRARGRGGLSAKAKAGLRVIRPRKPSKPSGSGGGLSGRYFWRTVNHVDWAWDNRGLAFVDGKWAYRGFPDAGLPRCTRQTAKGEDGEGCLRYTYDDRTKKIRLGGKTGKYGHGGLTLDGETYGELSIPKAGSRFKVSLIHRSFEGLCGSLSGCWTSASYLTMTPKGDFALSSFSLGTMGGGGLPFTASWTAPPDQYGRYLIGRRGLITLSYADGHKEKFTIGIEQDRRLKPSPAKEGLLLGQSNYYVED